MLASVLTTILFSFSVVFAARSSRLIGGPAANLGRLGIATLVLAVWTHGWGAGFGGVSLPWFLASGVVGFGLGDMALFGALPRIGPRLAILLTQCLAAPIAALTEWAWLGTTLHSRDMLCAAVVLTGVVIALAPDHGLQVERRVFWIGVLCGVGSAFGQACGAVLSRKAYDVAAFSHFPIDGGSAAYQRIIGGVFMTVLGFFLLRQNRRPAPGATPRQWGAAFPLVLVNALAGPTLGVACYQWALQSTESGIVLAIVATSPLVTIVLSYLLDGVPPTRRALTGGVVAVAGAIALKLSNAPVS
jgi:drug/metabolite transporter (DMT)-like permease